MAVTVGSKAADYPLQVIWVYKDSPVEKPESENLNRLDKIKLNVKLKSNLPSLEELVEVIVPVEAIQHV